MLFEDKKGRYSKVKVLRAAFVIAVLTYLSFSLKAGDVQEAIAKDITHYSVVVVNSEKELKLLAERYHTTVDEIIANNRDSFPITEGTVLTIKENTVKSPKSVSRESVSRGNHYELFYWPAIGKVTSHYGVRSNSFHHGIDIAADYNAEVKASKGGRVAKAGWIEIYGLTVVIDHGEGIETLYAHNSKLLVKKGDIVKAGQPIALAGSTGNATGPHVHFEVRVNGKAVDPSSYLPAYPILADKE